MKQTPLSADTGRFQAMGNIDSSREGGGTAQTEVTESPRVRYDARSKIQRKAVTEMCTSPTTNPAK